MDARTMRVGWEKQKILKIVKNRASGEHKSVSTNNWSPWFLMPDAL